MDAAVSVGSVGTEPDVTLKEEKIYMSDAAIRRAADWANSRCKDPKCIAREGHENDHRDLDTTWPKPTPHEIERAKLPGGPLALPTSEAAQDWFEESNGALIFASGPQQTAVLLARAEGDLKTAAEWRDTIDTELGVKTWWDEFQDHGRYNPATRGAIVAATRGDSVVT